MTPLSAVGFRETQINAVPFLDKQTVPTKSCTQVFGGPGAGGGGAGAGSGLCGGAACIGLGRVKMGEDFIQKIIKMERKQGKAKQKHEF